MATAIISISALKIQHWWRDYRKQMVQCYKCHSLQYPAWEGARKCSLCYWEKYAEEFGWTEVPECISRRR